MTRPPMYCAAEKEHGACEIQCPGCETEQEFRVRCDAAVSAERARLREAVEAERMPSGIGGVDKRMRAGMWNGAINRVLALLTDPPKAPQ